MRMRGANRRTAPEHWVLVTVGCAMLPGAEVDSPGVPDRLVLVVVYQLPRGVVYVDTGPL
jgi:hypothetical protein